MTDETTTRVLPKWVPAIREFQECFAKYFPHLLDDLDTAGGEMEWLKSRVFRNPLDTIRHSKAKRELKKMRAALNLMARHDTAYWLTMSSALFRAIEGGDEVAAKTNNIFEFVLNLDEWQGNGELDGILNRFFVEAERAIRATPDTSNINWRAIHAVDGLRTLWWRNTGRAGPARALNPASLFASFLKDGLNYLEIEGDHLSAFRRWAATSSDRK
jgi:hypothetical protein